MNIKEMEYIQAIAYAQSLSSAAKMLGISQPTLSIFLSELEHELGCDLFLREKKKMIPTPAGTIYIRAAEQIISVREQTYQGIHSLFAQPTEQIDIGVTPLRGASTFAKIYSHFSSRFPEYRLTMREGYMDQLQNLARHGAVSISLGSCFLSDYEGSDIYSISREEVILAVPSFHPLAAFGGTYNMPLPHTSLEPFCDTPFILMEKGSTIRRLSDFIFDKGHFTPTIAFESSNNLVVQNMIRKGNGIGLIPRSNMEKDQDDVRYFSLNPECYITLCAFVQKNRVLTEAERYLIYLMIREDMTNPNYKIALNHFTESIYSEFLPEYEVERDFS